MIRTHGGELVVGLGHERLQLFLKQLVSRLGGGGLHGGALGAVLRRGGIFPPVAAVLTGRAAVVPVPISAVLTLGLGFQALDGQVDLAVFQTNDHDLHVLALGQVLPDIADVGIGDLGNMYHACLSLRQGDECAKIGDRLDFTL